MIRLTTALFFGLSMATHAGTAPMVIPELTGIQIDGDPSDWADSGFEVRVLADPDGNTLSIDDFDVSFRLGWNVDGLVLLAVIIDDTAVNGESEASIRRHDCVDILVAEHVGSHNYYQLTIAVHDEPGRQRILDHRHGVDHRVALEAESAVFRTGVQSVVEIFLPWTNVGIDPKRDTAFGFQFMAHDHDGPGDGGIRLAWFPSCDTHRDPHAMHSLILGRQASRSVEVITRRLSKLNGYRLEMIGTPDLLGTPIEIVVGRNEIIETGFESRHGRAVAGIEVDLIEDAQPIDVWVDGRLEASFAALPTVASILKRYLEALGGEKALAAIENRRGSGTLIHNLCYKTPKIQEIPVDIHFGSPETFHMSQQSPDRHWREGCNARAGWTMDGEKVTRVHRERLSMLRWILSPHHVQNIPGLYSDLTVRRKTVRRGILVYQLEGKFGKGHRHDLFFDAKTGLITQWGHMRLDDYRGVDGVLLPFEIWMGRKGGSSTFVFDTFDHNVDIDTTLFSMPNPN